MIKRDGNIFSRLFRLAFSVLVLSALVMGIAFAVKGIYNSDVRKIARSVSVLLGKANINVEEEKIGDVAGKFVERVSNTNISATSTTRIDTSAGAAVIKSDPKLVLEVAFISDIHVDIASLDRAISKIKERNINKVIVIGDMTNYGEVSYLKEVKKTLDESGLTYYTLPGDHDLAASAGPANFIEVFGKSNTILDIEGYKFLLLDNSANFTELPPTTLTWFNDEVKDTDFVVLSQPLFTEGLNLPFAKMYMGSTREDPSGTQLENQQRVKSQRDALLSSVRKSAVKAVIAGDHHKSNEVIDSIEKTLEHHTLGSIANELNGLPQSLLQTPRFSILNVYNDKTFKVEDVLID